MQNSSENTRSIAAGGNLSWEICNLEETIPTKVENVTYLEESSQSMRARYLYAFIFFTTNLLAWFIRDYGNKVLIGIRYIKVCGNEGDDCIHAGGVLRVSLGCFIFFSVMFVTTFGAAKLHGARNSWHSSWWSVKFVLYLVSMIIPFITPEVFVHMYGEVARIGAGVFLLLQLMSVIHFITWCSNRWMPDYDSKRCGFIGLFLSTISYIASFCGIVLMYVMYAPDSSCTFNIFFIIWTAVLVKVLMIVSLHSKVNRGLLSSGIMGSYIVFLCWSAIHSEPTFKKCRVRKLFDESGHWTIILSFFIAVCAIVMATFSTGINSHILQFCRDEVRSEDDVPYKYEIFHSVFSMGAMYFAMLFISWELNHPTRKWSIDAGWASMWVKIINEWFAASLFLWNLISPVAMKKARESEGGVHDVPGSV